MNLELCKKCPHCTRYPRESDAPGLVDIKHIVYHCGLARAQLTKDGHGFSAANPTNIIAEDKEDHRIDPSTKRREFFRNVEVKPMFVIPANCPHKDAH